MKGLAFAYDPDGYYIELVPRDKRAHHPERYNLGQTMLRVKDIEKTLDFYTGRGGLGMTKVSRTTFLPVFRGLDMRKKKIRDCTILIFWKRRSCVINMMSGHRNAHGYFPLQTSTSAGITQF